MKVRNPLFLVLKTLIISTLVIVVITHYSKIPPQIPLFYSLSTPEMQVTGSLYLFLILIIGIVFLLLNTLIKRFFIDTGLLQTLIQIINIIIIITVSIIIIRIILLVT